MPESALPPDLIQAYLATRYAVQAEPPFVLTVGRTSGELAQLMAQHRCQDAVYLTACNPFSQVVEAEENERRQAALVQTLEHTGLVWVPGWGQGQNTPWPAEPSFLVLGLGREEGKVLGQQCEQNALLWCGADATPQLILLR